MNDYKELLADLTVAANRNRLVLWLVKPSTSKYPTNPQRGNTDIQNVPVAGGLWTAFAVI